MWFFPNGITFPDDQLTKLRAVGIVLVPGEVGGVDVTDDRLTGALLANGTRVGLDALAVPTLARARIDGLDGLGLNVVENASGTVLAADQAGRTSVPVSGLRATSSIPDAGRGVCCERARVAMTINTELVFAHADRAVIDHNESEKLHA